MCALSSSRMSSASLPYVLTPLLGREAELDHVLALIDEPGNRLVTIMGPGGVGKTRLALHVATTQANEFGRDVVYVPLAAVRDPHLVLDSIAQAMGGLMDIGNGFEERIAADLRERSPLLVLDNFEQLLDAAPLVGALLARAPECTALVTSQVALGIEGEQLYPLLPLPTPVEGEARVEAILQSEAVSLFVARARAVKPGLVIDAPSAITIAEICRRLDGLPLAIELAAARSNILSPNALLARLSNRLQVLGSDRRGVPDRLRTMRNAIAWSYDLLTPDEQSLFRHLSVFAGGVSLDAVEAVFSGEDGRDAYSVLAALVDHSLLQSQPLDSGEMRFLMLETLRHYGLEQLEQRGELDAANLAHAAYLLDLAETAGPHLTGHTQQEWLLRLDPEWENMRAALDWCLEHGQGEIALRIMGVLWRFCGTRGHVVEGRAFVARALAATPDTDSHARTHALYGSGYLAEDLRDLDVARGYFQQAQEMAARTGDALLESRSLIGLGTVEHDRGEYAVAIGFHERALALARKINDQRAIAIALGNLATVSYYRGKLDDAEQYWEESRARLRAVGDLQAEALAASNLGALAHERGEYARAQELLVRAIELQREMNNVRDLPFSVANLADTLYRLGDFDQAEELFASAVAGFREYADAGNEAIITGSYAKMVATRGDAARAAAMIRESMTVLVAIGDRLNVVRNAETLAAICQAHGDQATAVELLAATAAMREELGAALNPVERGEVETILSRARTALGEDRFAAQWSAGEGVDLDALVRRMDAVAEGIAGGGQIAVVPEPEPEPEPVEHNLTSREIEVLGLLAEGRSTKEISELLFISPRTTTTHVNNILGKLGMTSRTAAVAYAMRVGLV